MDYKIAVIGLGYVGLPLAIEFGKKYKVLGFDINKARVDELCQGRDHTMEADLEGMKQAVGLRAADAERGLAFSCDEQDYVYRDRAHAYRPFQHARPASAHRGIGNVGAGCLAR